MTNTTHTTIHPASGTTIVGGVLGTASDFVTGFFNALVQWNKRYDERKSLEEMPDYLLRDMGVTRADADLEASKPIWQV